MLSRNIVPAPKSPLSLQQTLELSNVYLENAYKTKDRSIVLLFCRDAEDALSQAKPANEKCPPAHLKDTAYQALRGGIAAAYIDLAKLLEKQEYREEAEAICKKTEKWG